MLKKSIILCLLLKTACFSMEELDSSSDEEAEFCFAKKNHKNTQVPDSNQDLQSLKRKVEDYSPIGHIDPFIIPEITKKTKKTHNVEEKMTNDNSRNSSPEFENMVVEGKKTFHIDCQADLEALYKLANNSPDSISSQESLKFLYNEHYKNIDSAAYYFELNQINVGQKLPEFGILLSRAETSNERQKILNQIKTCRLLSQLFFNKMIASLEFQNPIVTSVTKIVPKQT